MAPAESRDAHIFRPLSVTSAIDDVAQCEDSMLERFWGVMDKVLRDEISWDKIAVLFYVAGKLAGKLARKLAVHVGPELVQLVLWV